MHQVVTAVCKEMDMFNVEEEDITEEGLEVAMVTTSEEEVVVVEVAEEDMDKMVEISTVGVIKITRL